MAGQTYETNKKMKPYFTYEQLEQATCEGKQAFNSGLPIACPYIGEDSIPLRIRWLSGYDSARKTSIRAMDYGDGYGDGYGSGSGDDNGGGGDDGLVYDEDGDNGFGFEDGSGGNF